MVLFYFSSQCILIENIIASERNLNTPQGPIHFLCRFEMFPRNVDCRAKSVSRGGGLGVQILPRAPPIFPQKTLASSANGKFRNFFLRPITTATKVTSTGKSRCLVESHIHEKKSHACTGKSHIYMKKSHPQEKVTA